MTNLLTEIVKAIGQFLGIVNKQEERPPRIVNDGSPLALAIAKKKIRKKLEKE